jgi:hypothetical protein
MRFNAGFLALGMALLAGQGCAGRTSPLFTDDLFTVAQPLSRVHRAAIISANGNNPDCDPEGLAQRPSWGTGLAKQLREVGAHLGSDGKIYDRQGKEIKFWVHSAGPGCQMPQEMLDRQWREDRDRLEELRKTNTVIEIPYDGPAPC